MVKLFCLHIDLVKLCDVLYDTFGETNNSPLTNLNNGEYLLLLTTV
jgi:hypothetical protein